MPPLEPAPLHYTLRLKLHKTTILLVADPLAPLEHIKTELLRALTARYHSTNNTISTASGPARIPTTEADILLAKPVDGLNPNKGWRRLKTASDVAGDRSNGSRAVIDSNDEEDESHGNTNPNFKTPNGKRTKDITPKSNLPTSPREAGLKDGSVLAFKFRGHAVQRGTGDEDEGLGMEMDEDEEWDVVLPSYEDAAGLVGVGDGDGGGDVDVGSEAEGRADG